MLDAEGGVWLIEVNTNPSIEESSPLLKKIIPRMIDDAFKLTLDAVFPKPKKPVPPNVKANLNSSTASNSQNNASHVSTTNTSNIPNTKKLSMSMPPEESKAEKEEGGAGASEAGKENQNSINA
mmetsp:Transcript_27603/g.24280  ORF Transcript_27603/g.24280 Transcript_27603/m.24280 type:complete len:124 (-) Transcript_27603:546-917(-)